MNQALAPDLKSYYLSNMNKKLLVIEDDPGLRSQLKWCFEGFEVLQAEDMETAVKQLDEHYPRLSPWTWACPLTRVVSR